MEQRILVFVASLHDARLATRVLASAGVESAGCHSLPELLAQLGQGAGALLISEECLPQSTLAALAAHVARQPPWSDLPVLVMAQRGADSLHVQRAVERLGNVTMLERPLRVITLISAARSALRARARQYEMRTLSRRKDEFLATLAHELRNPLAPIRNAMAVLERGHHSPQVTKLTGIVERQVSHLTRLVDDLLDVARITSGKLELVRSRTTAQQVATHALEIAQANLAAKQHEVIVELPGDDIPLEADQVRLVQTVANLLVNAAKFTPPKGQVRLQVCATGSEVMFVVRDSGRGLAPDEIERIFEMFEQSASEGEPTGGLGLGLHLARAFARLHGGTVTARSDGLGRGSEFSVRLPVVVAAGRALPAPGDHAADAPGDSAWRVLVVDDNIDAAQTLQALLALHGMDASMAHDGATAVTRTRAENPDVVVMDLGMPVMDGYEAARQIRAHAREASPLLIALSGWGQEEDRARARQAGFDLHFVKPVDVGELLKCLSGLKPRAG